LESIAHDRVQRFGDEEANEPKEDALLQRVVGDDQKQMQGYKERFEIREVMGTRLAREVVLEPRR